jgi:diacylglycerol kinase (ATP)
MPTGADAVQLAVIAGVVVIVVTGLLLATPAGRRLMTSRGRSPTRSPLAQSWGEGEAGELPHATVVVNPTKLVDLEATQGWLERRSAELGWDRPRWAETTIEDLGGSQTRAAVLGGARAVLAYGGDGTVRTIAAALAGTGVPLGILAAGTGNLLARNLSLPITDLDQALDVALTGQERKVDVGLVEIDVSGEDHSPRREAFMVMAGVGFDAEVMAAVEPALKKRVGWWAYVVAGAGPNAGPPPRVYRGRG